jgi:hypothetical protein
MAHPPRRCIQPEARPPGLSASLATHDVAQAIAPDSKIVYVEIRAE